MKRRGYVFVDEVVPPIPKKITAGSVRRLSSLTPSRIRAKSSVVDVSTGEVVGYSAAIRAGLIQEPARRAASSRRRAEQSAKAPRRASGSPAATTGGATPVAAPPGPPAPPTQAVSADGTLTPPTKPHKRRKGGTKGTTTPTSTTSSGGPTGSSEAAAGSEAERAQSAKGKSKEGPGHGPTNPKKTTSLTPDMVAAIEYDNWRYRIRSRGYGEGAAMLDRFLDAWEDSIGREKTLKAVHEGIAAGLELKDYMFYRADGALDLINELLMFFPTSVNQFDDLKQFEEYMQEWEDSLW